MSILHYILWLVVSIAKWSAVSEVYMEDVFVTLEVL